MLALSVAAVLAVFLLYVSIAGGRTAQFSPSELRGHKGLVSLVGRVPLGRAPIGQPIAVVDAERPRRLLGERIAVPLAVCSANERCDDLEAPVRHVDRLAPEVGEPEVDVELEQIDT